MTDVRSYVVVTGCYWGLTLSDGALRMLVLLYFHGLGFDPIQIALLFLLYEAMGIVTNFAGGWLAGLTGLKFTLYLGLATQVVALVMLSFLQDRWAIELSVFYVMASQALSGIAKDLTKMSSKSAVKLVLQEDNHGQLFRWVALLTGSKNTLKGVGFFLGGAMLSGLGFQFSLWLMAGGLAVVLLLAMVLLGNTMAGMGRVNQKIRFRDLFAKAHNINILSAARIFLFASRDVWFVVGLPVFLSTTLGWSFTAIGSFMASWIIGYGMVQAAAPRLIGGDKGLNIALRSVKLWAFVLAGIPIGIASGLPSVTVLLVGLAVFAVVFAINSALHSYLIVACSDTDKVTLNVGFYYMANAAGRFVGTFLSGAVYQYGGLTACLLVSSVLVLICAIISLGLRGQGGVQYGGT